MCQEHGQAPGGSLKWIRWRAHGPAGRMRQGPNSSTSLVQWHKGSTHTACARSPATRGIRAVSLRTWSLWGPVVGFGHRKWRGSIQTEGSWSVRHIQDRGQERGWEVGIGGGAGPAPLVSRTTSHWCILLCLSNLKHPPAVLESSYLHWWTALLRRLSPLPWAPCLSCLGFINQSW